MKWPTVPFFFLVLSYLLVISIGIQKTFVQNLEYQGFWSFGWKSVLSSVCCVGVLSSLTNKMLLIFTFCSNKMLTSVTYTSLVFPNSAVLFTGIFGWSCLFLRNYDRMNFCCWKLPKTIKKMWLVNLIIIKS